MVGVVKSMVLQPLREEELFNGFVGRVLDSEGVFVLSDMTRDAHDKSTYRAVVLMG
jgi:hypothetical protein